MVEELLELIVEIILEPPTHALFRRLRQLVKRMGFLIMSPYLLLRGWLRLRSRPASLRELYHEGKQAAAQDMPYVLSAVAALPLLLLALVGLREGIRWLLAWYA